MEFSFLDERIGKETNTYLCQKINTANVYGVFECLDEHYCIENYNTSIAKCVALDPALP